MVTFTATVQGSPLSAFSFPSGPVTFSADGVTLGSGWLHWSSTGSQATWTTSSLAVGSHSITARYAGDSNFTGSSSPTLTEQIDPLVTNLTLNSSNQSALAA